MEDKFSALRKQLQCLGYTQHFSEESLPLVESLTDDLVQTTYSLQYYMGLCKETLRQRDSWKVATEPFKSDNAKLIKENNRLHLDLLRAKEEAAAARARHTRQLDALRGECDSLRDRNEKLGHRCREYRLKNICADTVSSSNKSKVDHRCKRAPDTESHLRPAAPCSTCIGFKSKIEELSALLDEAGAETRALMEKNSLLESQLSGRDTEIKRLNRLVQSSRFEAPDRDLNGQLMESLSKRHRAMSRAMELAEKNKTLENHLRLTDRMALKVEAECNSKLRESYETVAALEDRLKDLTSELAECRTELARSSLSHQHCAATIQRKDNEISALRTDLDDLTECKRRLLSENDRLSRLRRRSPDPTRPLRTVCDCREIVQKEFTELLEKERRRYEEQIDEVKSKLSRRNEHRNDENSESMDKLRFERDFYFKEYGLLKRTAPGEECVRIMKEQVERLERQLVTLELENRSVLKENDVLKKRLDDDIQSHDKRSKPVLEGLERDLSSARNAIKRLEEEREGLLVKLKSVSESESTYRHLYEIKLPEEKNTLSSSISKYREECATLKENLKACRDELLHTKTLYDRSKNIQSESEKNLSAANAGLLESRKEANALKTQLVLVEKQKNDLEFEIKLLKGDRHTLKENIDLIDKERDRLVMDVDSKTERLSTLEHQLRSKSTSVELLENKVAELNGKLDTLSEDRASLERKVREGLTCNEALSFELDSVTKQRDHALMENRRLRNDLVVLSNDARSFRREYELSRKEVEEMKQQLQHYVDEVRRIEEILSQKEAERNEMLDRFASLSRDATDLETGNRTLETDTYYKDVRLREAADRLDAVEKKLKMRDAVVRMQEDKISDMMLKMAALESELEKRTLHAENAERTLLRARETCSALEDQKRSLLIDSERRDLESGLGAVRRERRRTEAEPTEEGADVRCSEKFLCDGRREVSELKSSLREALDENGDLRSQVERCRRRLDAAESESSVRRRRTEDAAEQLHGLQRRMTDETLGKRKTRETL